MQAVRIVFYRDRSGNVPVHKWLANVPRKAHAKCVAVLQLLQEEGYLLGMPHRKPLRDGIHELRTRFQRVRYRLLFAFDGQKAVILHAITKQQSEVPDADIERARARWNEYLADRKRHSYPEADPDEES